MVVETAATSETHRMAVGGIEAGGTKWVCALSSGGDRLEAVETFPTTEPDETIGRAIDFFATGDAPQAIGVGCFGPIDVDPSSPTWGHITTTPKPGWANTDVGARLKAALEVPVAFDTDVNAAAVGEWRWGAGVGLDTFCYLTVGTGIGAGVIVNGAPVHGLMHPEIGHVRVPHDRERDPFDGGCPFHGDCLEGLASGEALRLRWGRPGEELEDDGVWELEADYLALGLVNVVCTLSPQRIVVGGGVAARPGLLARVARRLQELLAGYIPAAPLETDIEDYLVAPALGDRAGVLGAIELARDAVERR
jgi:fructokinase